MFTFINISADNGEKKNYRLKFFSTQKCSSIKPKIEQILLYMEVEVDVVQCTRIHTHAHTLIRSLARSHKHLKAGIVNAA